MKTAALLIVCAWCPGFVRPVASDPLASHTICPTCLVRVLKGSK